MLDQQEQSAQMQTQTVETLHRLNQTFQFLLRVSESSRDQLNWIQSLVVNTGIYTIELWECQVFNAFKKTNKNPYFHFGIEKKVGKLSTWILHVCYFLIGMLLLAFAQAPSYTRWIFLVLVPINLTMDLQQGVAMDVPALVTLLFMFSFGNA